VDDSERELVEGLRRGEAAAFDRVYALYRGRIYNFLYRLAGRRDLAEDLFQETFLKLARSAGGLREDTTLAAWLFTVARNQYRSHRRWAVLDATRMRGLADEPEEAHGAGFAGPAANAEARRALTALERALASLSPTYREVLLLVAVEGMEQEQVAQILGIDYAAVRQRLSRGRALLAERLQASDGPAERKREGATS
jgi:RNA polymerase sigma-70 factor (ECF subfamily)